MSIVSKDDLTRAIEDALDTRHHRLERRPVAQRSGPKDDELRCCCGLFASIADTRKKSEDAFRDHLIRAATEAALAVVK